MPKRENGCGDSAICIRMRDWFAALRRGFPMNRIGRPGWGRSFVGRLGFWKAA